MILVIPGNCRHSHGRSRYFALRSIRLVISRLGFGDTHCNPTQKLPRFFTSISFTLCANRQLLREFMHAKLENPLATHERLIAAYRAIKTGSGWNTCPNDGYFLDYLSYHLLKANELTELHVLLTASPVWMDTKFAALKSHASYINDISLLLATYRIKVVTVDDIIKLFELKAARLVVNHNVDAYEDDDLVALVYLNRMDEAIEFASLRSDEYKCFQGIEAIYEAGHRLGKEVSGLLDLLKNLINSANAHQEYMRSRLIRLILNNGELEVASSMASEINDQSITLYLFCDIALALAKAGRRKEAKSLFNKALTIIRTSGSLETYQENDGIAYAIGALCKANFEKDAANLLSDYGWRDEIHLKQVFAEGLISAGKLKKVRPILKEIEASAASIGNLKFRGPYLRRLIVAYLEAGFLAEGEAKLPEILTVLHTIPDADEKAWQLHFLASALFNARIFDAAVEISRTIDNELWKIYTLADEIEVLLKDERVSEAYSVIDTCLSTIRDSHEENNDRLLMLRNIMRALINTNHIPRLAEILALRIEPDPGSSDTVSFALRDLVRVLPSLAGWEKAFEIAHRIQDIEDRNFSIWEISMQLSDMGHFEKAEEIISKIGDEALRKSAIRELCYDHAKVKHFDDIDRLVSPLDTSLQDDIFVMLVEFLLKMQEIEGAERIANRISDREQQDRAFRYLVEGLAENRLFEEATVLIEKITNSKQKGQAVESIVSSYCTVGELEIAEKLARSIKYKPAKTIALCHLGKCLLEKGNRQKAEKIYRQCRKLGQFRGRFDPLDLSVSFALMKFRNALFPAESSSDASAEETTKIEPTKVSFESLMEVSQVLDAIEVQGMVGLDKFIEDLCHTAPFLEKMKPGLALSILKSTTQILAWSRSDWRDVSIILTK